MITHLFVLSHKQILEERYKEAVEILEQLLEKDPSVHFHAVFYLLWNNMTLIN